MKILNVKKINENIVADTRKVLLDTESRYRGQLFNVAEKILANRHIEVVLLAGPSCAGKTTSARLLKEIFEQRGRDVITLSMDDFFIDREKSPVLPNGLKDFDSPCNVNTEQMKECFDSLLADKETGFPEYDFISGKNISNRFTYKKKYNTIIIFEGLHVLNPKVNFVFDPDKCYKIYVNALSNFSLNKKRMNTVDIRLLRRMIRDVRKRNHTPEKTLESWQLVCDAEKKYITPFKKYADSIIDTTHEYELSVFKGEFNTLIKQKKITYDAVNFREFLEESENMDINQLPDTSLMWEFLIKPEKKESEEK